MKPILFSFVFLLSFQQPKNKISLKTKAGDIITVTHDSIYFNNQPVSPQINDIIYGSKYNRIIEENSSILLFLEIDGRPNYNRLKAFDVTSHKATELADCVYNDESQGIGPKPFTDMDKDGKLEFGGFDITEAHPSKDSMYYNPSTYYEINKGRILFDSVLTRQMDIKINGIYLLKPFNASGNCCIVVKKRNNK